jgi:hypothetical protein
MHLEVQVGHDVKVHRRPPRFRNDTTRQNSSDFRLKLRK